MQFVVQYIIWKWIYQTQDSLEVKKKSINNLTYYVMTSEKITGGDLST